MFRATRTAVAGVLAAAIAALPVVLGRCAVSCEMHRHSAVETTASCHHVSPPRVRLSPPPSPCGHNHATVVAASAVPAKHADLSTHSLPACVDLIAAAHADVVSRAVHAAISPPPVLPIALVLPLRV